MKFEIKGLDKLEKRLQELSDLKNVPFKCPSCEKEIQVSLGMNRCPHCNTEFELTN